MDIGGVESDRINIPGDSVIVWDPDSDDKVMGVFPHWKGIEYANDHEFSYVQLRDVGWLSKRKD
jgi:hypothetical protein